MVVRSTSELASLYLEDETAWLETMARLVAERRFEELDCDHLAEYLDDMARRDRREVKSRLANLLTLLLKSDHQPEQRTCSWRGTILEQRSELRQLLESGTLRNHAIDCLAKAYQDARRRASAESNLPIATFPTESLRSVDDLIAEESEVDPA